MKKMLMTKRDRTPHVFAAAILVAMISYWKVVTSVHTYCEVRLAVGVIALLVIMNLAFFVGNNAVTMFHKIMSGVGVALLLLATILNGSFLVWATRTCQNQQRSYQR